jgi:nucleoside-triphosphatase THEP1
MRIAAIKYRAGEAEKIDAMLCGLAGRLRREGYKLAGSIQWNKGAESGYHCDMDFEDLASGRRLRGSIDQACPTEGCRLDSSALEDAAGLVAASIAPGIDLVIINRYGKQEVQGRGFRQAIAAAIAQDLPVLTVLNKVHDGSFAAFTGEAATELPPTLEAIEDWCRALLPNVPLPKGFGEA